MRRQGLKSAVLDSYAVLAFLFREPGHEIVLSLLEKAVESDMPIFIASPNWAEIRYMIERKAGLEKWWQVREKLMGLPMEVVAADLDMAEGAGRIKAAHKMSLADCFAAALAIQKKAEIYTGDPEFRSVENEVKIVWL
jgi:predicted nucleic acid-binding protein